jgi:hypothetical protein
MAMMERSSSMAFQFQNEMEKSLPKSSKLIFSLSLWSDF